MKVKNQMNSYIDTEYYASRQKNRKYERGYRDKDIAMEAADRKSVYR